MVSRSSRGFTLIEMMIVITLFMLFAVMGTHLSGVWVNKNKIHTADDLLISGYKQAKTYALRNEAGNSNGVGIYFFLKNNTLCLQSAAETPSAISCDNALWQTKLPTTSSFIDSNATACIALSSSAIPLSFSIAGTTCATTLSYRMTVGEQSDSGTLE